MDLGEVDIEVMLCDVDIEVKEDGVDIDVTAGVLDAALGPGGPTPRRAHTPGGCGLTVAMLGDAGVGTAIVMGMGGIYRGLIREATLLVDKIGADLWLVQGSTRGPFAEISRVPANLEDRARAVRRFLAEDVETGDATTERVVPETAVARGSIVVRSLSRNAPIEPDAMSSSSRIDDCTRARRAFRRWSRRFPRASEQCRG